ncbi:hypothetical protein [Gimesia sp.]|uniref:ApeA N-terminal domain 1-containing protein n=1 Tax=Gimesia sp. TaxID=2024833 RepID=UPI0032EEA757
MSGFKNASSVHDQIILDAEWWIPSAPNHKFRGTLSGSVKNGFILNLQGAFLQEQEDIRIIDAIIGESRTGERYTLLNYFCLSAQRKTSFTRHSEIKKTLNSSA